MTRDEWLTALAAELEIARPADAEVDDLLELAAIAAHSAERTAAPLSCWLAGKAGVAPAAALAAARRLEEAHG
jgi:hypothetical protein